MSALERFASILIGFLYAFIACGMARVPDQEVGAALAGALSILHFVRAALA